MDFIHKGSRIHRSTGCASKREAQKVERNVRESFKDTSLPSLSPMTLKQALDRCLKERWASKKDGQEQYNRLQLVITILGDMALTAITPEHIQTLKDKLSDMGRKPSTINRYLAGLSTVFNLAVKKWHTMPSVPYFEWEEESEGRIRWITDQEEKVILAWFNDHDMVDMADLTVVLLDTGMRLGELLTLEPAEVNFDTHLIHIWKNKGNRPRSIPMTPRVETILQGSKGFLAYSHNQVEYRWEKMRHACSFTDDMVIHALRHTCASRLVQAGVDLYTVKEWLGHSSIRVTERYAHLAPNRLQKAVSALVR